MVLLALALAAGLAASDLSPEPDLWARISPELMRQIETGLMMPSGASPIERYDRFYSVEWRGDHPVVQALFIERRPEQSEGSNYRLVGAPPVWITGGGCGVVNLTFEPTEGAVTDIACNPETVAEVRPMIPTKPAAGPQVINLRKR